MLIFHFTSFVDAWGQVINIIRGLNAFDLLNIYLLLRLSKGSFYDFIVYTEEMSSFRY
jgi:hypothetical protein